MTHKNIGWHDISINEKVKLSLSVILITSSVILGFLSFLVLNNIPNSVIGISGVWCSTSLALLGIASYFNNELAKMRTQVREKINELDDIERRKFNREDIEEEV